MQTLFCLPVIFNLPIPFLLLVVITSISWEYDLNLEQNSTTLLLLLTIVFSYIKLYRKQFLTLFVGIFLFGFIFHRNTPMQYSNETHKKEEVYTICKMSTNMKSILLNGNTSKRFFCYSIEFINNNSKKEEKKTYLIYENPINKHEKIVSIKGILHYSKNKNNFNILVPHTIKYLDQNEVISNKFFINLDISDLSRAFLKAFVFGIKDELDTSHKRIFINSGTMHLFAVSGLHVGCLFIAIFSICKILGSTHNFSMIVTMVILLGYLYLVNFSISSTRAYIMLCIWVLCKLLGLRVNKINVVAIAGLCMLLYDSGNFLDIGFILSITVVLSIVWFVQTTDEKNKKGNRLIESMIKMAQVNYSAFWGSFLILAKYFGLIVPVSLLSNLLIIPIVSIMMPFCIFTICILNTVNLSFVAYSLNVLIFFLIKICSYFASFSWSTYQWETTSSIQINDFYFFIALLITCYGGTNSLLLRSIILPVLSISVLFF